VTEGWVRVERLDSSLAKVKAEKGGHKSKPLVFLPGAKSRTELINLLIKGRGRKNQGGTTSLLADSSACSSEVGAGRGGSCRGDLAEERH